MELKARVEVLQNSQRLCFSHSQRSVCLVSFFYTLLYLLKEVLVTIHRNLLGEDLAPLGTTELDQLESQVGKTLRQIRSRKVIKLSCQKVQEIF